MYSHRITLGNSALPYAAECFVEQIFRAPSYDFINECDVLACRKNQGEFVFSCDKNVIDGVFCAVDYLDVLHTPYPQMFQDELKVYSTKRYI